jgi:hypothetical protein
VGKLETEHVQKLSMHFEDFPHFQIKIQNVILEIMGTITVFVMLVCNVLGYWSTPLSGAVVIPDKCCDFTENTY